MTDSGDDRRPAMSSPPLPDRIAALWRELSTGAKMFLILGLGLLPLGVIAIAASIARRASPSARPSQLARNIPK